MLKLGTGLGIGFGDFPVLGGVMPWNPYPGAAIHLDFIALRYYWGGSEKTAPGDFVSWTGVTIGANGLEPNDATAVILDATAVPLAPPCVLAVVLFPTTSQNSRIAGQLYNDSDEVANVCRFNQIFGPDRMQMIVTTSGSTQATGTNTITLGQKTAWGYSIAPNNVLFSKDGIIATTADTLANMPSGLNRIRVGNRNAVNTSFGGSIRHFLGFPGTMDQATLNNLTADLLSVG